MASSKRSKVIPFYIVDAFVVSEDDPFTGNPAAVCVLGSDDEISDELKQKIAAEINLSETAFVASESENGGCCTLRWFTPTTEVPLCGHATLATAKVLFERMASLMASISSERTSLKFESRCKGTLTATMDWKTSQISLDFPAVPSRPLDPNQENWINEVVAQTVGSHNRSKVKNVEYADGLGMVLIDLDPESGLDMNGFSSIKPNFDNLVQIRGPDTLRAVILTMKASDTVGSGNEVKPTINFYSRYFGPWDGVNEDPVCGSSFSVLTPYWSKVFSSNSLRGRQCSKRGGIVNCSLDKDGSRVQLSGGARIVVKGELNC